MAAESTATGVKDWHSSKHIAKRARYLLEHPDEEIPSDVTFLVGDGSSEPQKTFRCHKLILAMVSSMFQAMFYGSFPETEDNIKIPDVTPKAFQNMLRYAYGDKAELDTDCMEDAMDTLYCAKKYLITKLERSCRDHIQLHIAALAKDPCVVFQKAPQMDEENLAALALARIALRTSEVMQGDAFLRLSFDCIKRIVDCIHLNADETDIYRGVRRWVEHNGGLVTGSALREAFGSLLYSIRFPMFTAVELADGPVTDGVLTAEETSSVYQFLFARVKPALPFITTPRRPLDGPLFCFFDLVTAPVGTRAGLVGSAMLLMARPDLAPRCCAFLEQLVESKLHIRIASYDNEYPGKTVPFPAAVLEERSILSYSAKGACWFEWDMLGGTACNTRIGIGRKPAVCHSAVFGLIVGSMNGTAAPLDSWDDKGIQGLTNFQFHVP